MKSISMKMALSDSPMIGLSINPKRPTAIKIMPMARAADFAVINNFFWC
jgi:hypothetical protein